jgi:hypothetical protein
MEYWANSLFGKKNSEIIFSVGPRFCFGGYFAGRREAIIRHPKALFAAVLSEQKGPNQEVDHFMERMWTPIFLSETPFICHQEEC